MCEGLKKSQCNQIIRTKVKRFSKEKHFTYTEITLSDDTYKSLAEYCLVIAERSLSRAPVPPRAVSNVGRAAVVIFGR